MTRIEHLAIALPRHMPGWRCLRQFAAPGRFELRHGADGPRIQLTGAGRRVLVLGLFPPGFAGEPMSAVAWGIAPEGHRDPELTIPIQTPPARAALAISQELLPRYVPLWYAAERRRRAYLGADHERYARAESIAAALGGRLDDDGAVRFSRGGSLAASWGHVTPDEAGGGVVELYLSPDDLARVVEALSDRQEDKSR